MQESVYDGCWGRKLSPYVDNDEEDEEKPQAYIEG